MNKDLIIKAIHNIESRRGNIRELTTAEIVLELESELSALKALTGEEVSEPGFVRSGNCPDEIVWQGIEYVKKSSIIDYTCDACGCHPSVIINTPKGRFCQQHVQY